MGCLDANDVVRFLDGDAPAEAAQAIEDHIDGCADCRALVTELGRSIEVVEPARGSGGSGGSGGSPEGDVPWEATSGAELVDRGTQVDRYVVLDAVGAGAMGVVYRAYDPELDRDVALKLVRVLGDEAGRAQARTRLLREAQSMARLAHPNVVAVHDASTFGAHVFVAMELVEGVDLAAWLAQEARPWRAIAHAFVDAGRGLAAAHAAGIVHRDFKPSNVLVGNDGRVRVTDFGLAVPATESTGAPAAGTPAYMSPELRDGAPADEASDQYGYAVALCEAVSGERRPSPRVPAPLRPVLRRGMAAAPRDRYPAMDAMVAAVARAAAPRTARWIAAGAVVALAAGGGYAGYRIAASEPEVACAAPADKLAGVWDPPRKAAVRAAFAATKEPGADRTWQRVEGSLDRYAAAWNAAHVEACEATHVRHEQSEQLLDLRMACLRTELARLAALTDAFASADAAVVKRAAGAAALGDGLKRCADVAALGADSPLPRDPANRARLDVATRELARAESISMRGKYGDAIAGARRVIAEAKALGYARLEADATRSLGESQWRAGDIPGAIQNLYAAIDAAKRAHATDLEAGALLTLVAVLGFEDARHDEALQVARLAESAIRATGDDARLGKLISNRGAIYFGKQDYAAAAADFKQARELIEKVYGPNDRRVGQAVMNEALVAGETGDLTGSLPSYARALAIFEATLGPRHPEVALTLANRASVLGNLGRHDEALHDLERALSIRREVLGPDHRDTAQTEYVIAEVELLRHNYTAALARDRAVLAVYERTLRPGHPLFGAAHGGIGRALGELHRYAEAIPELDQAIAVWDANKLDGPQQGQARFALAVCLWETRRDRKRAVELANHALATLRPEDTGVVKQWLAEHARWSVP